MSLPTGCYLDNNRLQCIVALNSFGVSALVDSRLGDAVSAFHHAMTMVDTIVQNGNQALGQALPFKIKMVVPTVSSAAKRSGQNDHNPYEVLDFPIHIQPVECESHESGDPLCTTLESISSALTYNFGLSLHLKGLIETSSQSDRLLSVSSIYETLLVGSRGDTERDMAKMYVNVAVWNNLLHIRSHFLQTDKMKQCLETLREALLDYSSSPEQLLPVTQLVVHNLLVNPDAAWNTAPGA